MSALCQKRTSARFGRRGRKDIVGGHRAANALEVELTHEFDGDGFIDRQHDTGANQDLSRLGFITEPGSDIRNRANRGVVEPSFKPNSAKGGKSMRYADPKAKIVTQQTPFLDHCSNGGSHIQCHQNGLEGRVFHGHRIVEDHHHAIASKALKRAAVLNDDLADSRMVVAQESHHIFRVRAFREASKPRRSQNSAVISRRWLSSCFSVPDATIRSATWGGRKRRNLPIRSISPTWSATRCSSCWLSLFRSLSSRVFSIAITACAAKFFTSSICLSVNGRTSWR